MELKLQGKRGFFAGAITALVLIVSTALVVVSLGLYSVAASSGHLDTVEHFLSFVMHRSVKAWSLTVSPPPGALDTPARISVGAAHFSAGCANCHGAPGYPVNPIHAHMLPAPPKLASKAGNWTEEQLFWLVQNGIKYTGMPFWSGTGRADEVWSIVAFLQHLPTLDGEAYRALTLGNAGERVDSASNLVVHGDSSLQIAACDRCHDTSTAGAISALVPRLGGQQQDYIALSLQHYHGDKRQSGMMEPIASELDDKRIALLAQHYATLRSPIHPQLPAVDKQAVTRGSEIAEQGDTSRDLPACSACHGDGKLSVYPILNAQPAAYTEMQLALWKDGGRSQTTTGALMAEIATRMTQQQIVDVSAYYQTLPPPLPSTEAPL